VIKALIKRLEGYAKRLSDGRCTTYLCSANVVTIGHGSTGEGVTPGAVWTEQQADERLDRDLQKFSRGVYRLSPVLADETEGRKAAIISFCYNVGLGAYSTSTLRKAVNRGDWEESKRQLLRWNKAGGKIVRGLTLRRTVEAELL
jgi:lysozyme